MKHAAQSQTQLFKRLFVFLGGAEVEQVVVQPASRQELNREIVKTLRLFTAARFLLKTPLEHDLVTHRAGNRRINLLRRCIFDGAAIVAQQLVENGLLNRILVILVLQRHV